MFWPNGAARESMALVVIGLALLAIRLVVKIFVVLAVLAAAAGRPPALVGVPRAARPPA